MLIQDESLLILQDATTQDIIENSFVQTDQKNHKSTGS